MDDREHRRAAHDTAPPTTVLDELSEREIRALADPYARTTLRYLDEHAETTLADLADVVTGSEAAATGSISGPQKRRTNLVRLHHQTLPRLTDCGLAAYDPEDSVVSCGGVPGPVVELLEWTD